MMRLLLSGFAVQASIAAALASAVGWAAENATTAPVPEPTSIALLSGVLLFTGSRLRSVSAEDSRSETSQKLARLAGQTSEN
jgi:hypothetical protein